MLLQSESQTGPFRLDRHKEEPCCQGEEASGSYQGRPVCPSQGAICVANWIPDWYEEHSI